MAKYHKHHIIPRHMGGDDSPENIIELTVSDHAKAHYDLYEKFGKKEDLCAYHMLSGNIEEFRKIYSRLGGEAIQRIRKEQNLSILGITKEEHANNIQKWSSSGGAIGGKTNAESGHMRKISLSLTDEERTNNGKKSAEKCRELQVNAFFDPKLRTEIARLGGAAQGKVNAESGHLTRINAEYWNNVKNGKVKRDKRHWYYSDANKHSIQIKEGDDIPAGYIKGRKIYFNTSEEQ